MTITLDRNHMYDRLFNVRVVYLETQGHVYIEKDVQIFKKGGSQSVGHYGVIMA